MPKSKFQRNAAKIFREVNSAGFQSAKSARIEKQSRSLQSDGYPLDDVQKYFVPHVDMENAPMF